MLLSAAFFDVRSTGIEYFPPRFDAAIKRRVHAFEIMFGLLASVDSQSIPPISPNALPTSIQFPKTKGDISAMIQRSLDLTDFIRADVATFNWENLDGDLCILMFDYRWPTDTRRIVWQKLLRRKSSSRIATVQSVREVQRLLDDLSYNAEVICLFNSVPIQMSNSAHTFYIFEIVPLKEEPAQSSQRELASRWEEYQSKNIQTSGPSSHSLSVICSPSSVSDSSSVSPLALENVIELQQQALQNGMK